MFISLTVDVNEQMVRLLAMESGIRAGLIRANHQNVCESQAFLDARTKLEREARPRFWLSTEGGPALAGDDMVAGKPFDPHYLMSARLQLMRESGATGCVIFVDEMASIAVPRETVAPPDDRYVHDHEYDAARLERVELLQRMTESADRPLGDPTIVVAGIRKQMLPNGTYQVRGPSRIVSAADCIAFLVPRRPTRSSDTEMQHLVLRVAKSRYGTEGAIPMDLDVSRYRFTEVPEQPGDVPDSWRRDSTWD
jgi:hypothetical protein